MTKPNKKDDEKKPPKKPEDMLHGADDTLCEASAGGPNATERSSLRLIMTDNPDPPAEVPVHDPSETPPVPPIENPAPTPAENPVRDPSETPAETPTEIPVV